MIALAFLLLLASSADAACIKHTPSVRFAELVQVYEPGDTVTNEVVFRNTDSCECPRTCFALNTGWHPPHDGASAIRIGRTSLTPVMNHACLLPGEEARAFWTVTISAEQDTPQGYVSPVAEMRRANAWPPKRDVDFFEGEGGALCIGMTTRECHAHVYQAGPEQ